MPKRSVAVLVVNDVGELALQLRAGGDKKFPLHWDFSAAGGIEVDEEPEQAAKRELKEEIGIVGELELVEEVLYEGEGSDDYLYVYRLTHNGPFVVDQGEVERVEYFSLGEIEQMLGAGVKFHPELRELWCQKRIQKWFG